MSVVKDCGNLTLAVVFNGDESTVTAEKWVVLGKDDLHQRGITVEVGPATRSLARSSTL